MKKIEKNGLKCLKGFHMIAVSCWIGGSVALVLQFLLKGDIGDGAEISGLQQSILQYWDRLIFVLPGAIGCLVTGLFYGVSTNWGFLKHKWIQFKWITSVTTLLLGLLFLGPGKSLLVYLSGFSGMTALTANLYRHEMILIFCGFQLLLLSTIVFVSTFKPWNKRLAIPAPQEFFHRKWLVTIAVGTGVFLATLDGSIVNVSLPTMVQSLETNFTMIQWVILAYLLTVTTLMLGFGRLGDILGKKRIYLLGFIIFTIASAACGLASNIYFLIGFRIVQGAGAAMIMALGAAIITEAFPPKERGKAMGIIGFIVSMGIVIGPVLGGIIVDLWSWNGIFFVNIPIGIGGIWMIWHFIPNLNPPEKQKFDFAGAMMLFGSLICFLIGLSLGQQHGFTHTLVLILLFAAFVFMISFIMVEFRVHQPMINLSLFRNPLLCVNLLTGFISFVALGGIFILIPFYLEVILGFQTMKAGLLMCVIPIMMGICSPIAGILSDHLGHRPITLLALAILLGGYLASGTLNTQTDELGFILRIFAIGAGMGLFVSPNNSAIMGAGAKNQLGITSGLMAITRTLGQTVGVSLIGTLWVLRVRVFTGNRDLTDIIKAPLSAQVSGLQFIFLIVALLIFIGLCISMYGYRLNKKIQKTKQSFGPPEHISSQKVV